MTIKSSSKQSSYSNPTFFSGVGKHFIWYFFGSVFSIIIAFVKTPIFTGIFSPEDFGYYSIVQISCSVTAIVFFNWATSTIWRFYFEAKKSNRLSSLYITIGYGFLFISLLFLLALLAIYYIVDNILLKKLILFGGVAAVTTEASSLLLLNLKIENKSAQYNLLSTIQIVLAFVILLFLTLYMKMGIESYFSSVCIANSILIIWRCCGVNKLPLSIYFRKKGKTFRYPISNYIKLTIVLNVFYFLLINIDKYFIQFFKGAYDTGIYSQVYNVGHFAIFSLVSVFLSATTPNYYKAIENTNDDLQLQKLMLNTLRLYFVIFIPITFYTILYSKEICSILLNGAFQHYYYLLPPIILSNFIYGLTHFSFIKFRFENKRHLLYEIYGWSLVVNITLNMFFLQFFTFEIASLVTLISYLVLFLFCYKHDLNEYITKNVFRPLSKGIIVLIIQAITHFLLRYFFLIDNTYSLFVELVLFIFLYFMVTRKSIIFNI